MGSDASPTAAYDSFHHGAQVRAQLEGHTHHRHATSSPQVEMGRAGGAMMQGQGKGPSNKHSSACIRPLFLFERVCVCMAEPPMGCHDAMHTSRPHGLGTIA